MFLPLHITTHHFCYYLPTYFTIASKTKIVLLNSCKDYQVCDSFLAFTQYLTFACCCCINCTYDYNIQWYIVWDGCRLYVYFFLGRTQKIHHKWYSYLSRHILGTYWSLYFFSSPSNRSTLWHCFSANGLSSSAASTKTFLWSVDRLKGVGKK